MKNIFLNNKNKGFTLIELMVATSIFMIVMLMALGAIVTSSNASKNYQKIRDSVDNVNFALESMTRAIRMGNSYSCLDGSDSDCQELAFTSSSSDYIIYRQESNDDGTYNLCKSKNGGTCVPIVSEEVNIEKLSFSIKGEDVNDDTQPSVYIIIKGSCEVKDQKISFSIQTMASQRNFE